jgi:hypothetical protein
VANPTIALQSTQNPGNSFTKPTVSNGDWMVIAYFWFARDATNPVAPSGWTQVYTVKRLYSASDYLGSALFVRLVDGTEGAGAYAVTDPPGTVWWRGGGMFRVQGAANPSADDSGTANNNSNAPSTGAIVDASVAEDLALITISSDGVTLGSVTGLDTTVVKELDMDNTCLYYEPLSGTHTGGTYSTTMASAVNWVAGFSTMKPAAGGGGGSTAVPVFMNQYRQRRK